MARGSRGREPIQVVRLPWGCDITVDTRETIGRAIWQIGLYELTVVETLWRLIRPGDLALDVGANVGAVTSALATRAGEVWAFEPHPVVYSRLQQNLNGFENYANVCPVKTYPCALAENDGQIGLDCSAEFATNQGTARISRNKEIALQVPSARLDGLLGDRIVGAMKLDVEGAEAAVLEGASDAVSAGRIINIVLEDHRGPTSAVLSGLKAAGYAVFEMGWRLHRPHLGTIGSGLHRSYEPPNYLATLEPDRATKLIKQRGWNSLRPQVLAT